MAGSNLPSIRRFFVEDYKEAPAWFQKFIGTFNLYSDPMYTILDQGVDVMSNTKDEIYTLDVNNASATATDNATTFSPRKFVGAPNGILVGQCLWNTDNGIATAIGAQVTLDWVWSGSQVSILAIYGLTAGEDYTLSLRIY